MGEARTITSETLLIMPTPPESGQPIQVLGDCYKACIVRPGTVALAWVYGPGSGSPGDIAGRCRWYCREWGVTRTRVMTGDGLDNPRPLTAATWVARGSAALLIGQGGTLSFAAPRDRTGGYPCQGFACEGINGVVLHRGTRRVTSSP